MRKQLTFEFKNEFCEKWLDTLSKAQKAMKLKYS